jgi:hypothetical protein
LLSPEASITGWHIAATQAPVWQSWPQDPQFFESEVTSMQDEPQGEQPPAPLPPDVLDMQPPAVAELLAEAAPVSDVPRVPPAPPLPEVLDAELVVALAELPADAPMGDCPPDPELADC